ncbi:MAG: hypothetical protein A2Y76_07850 [Planctomycetes bacterium RBG_13_60_9]|nr:MAG: hypothetical protein A2Y76_07850 [Planctomycetes bacterium RBG_13_60_9]
MAYVLVLIGALNWGLIGFFQLNLVAALFGALSMISRIIYALVGLAAIYNIVALPGMLRRWHAPAARVEAVREPEREHLHV